ncbi:thioredoxin O, mitochondrial isoform X2 [Aegilops tauschii subsp. strangulata]|nr:LOW QUALITY PROTEIN: thioredoxin O, mitochondrial [Aegilops tauschii subsp. strangulata]XP_044442450.1 thioredoxin O, mitochondrial-like isoform X2 [Triticum aestivum]
MARRLCRLPRLLLPLAAAPKHQPRLPAIPALNPSPAARLRPSSSPTPTPSLPAFPRLFSSSSAGDSSMVVVGSADSYEDIHAKVQAEKLPAVFYYTAVWCGPCRAMAPVIEKMSRQYPKIPVYKVDIDMEGLGTRLSNLKIFSIPTFHFYHKGEKSSEVVGADVKKLEAAMESLHK